MSLPEDDEGLAAEYALGTLDEAERAAVAARRLREPALDAMISEWERRLAPLSENAAPRRPPAGVYEKIESRLGLSAPANDPIAALRARLRRWRAAAAGGGALSVGLAAALALTILTRPATPHQFVAVLQKGPDTPAFAMTVDLDKLQFSVRPIAATAPEGKSYELWIIAPSLGAPKSLGVIDANAVSPERRLSAYDVNVVRQATYAVTVEPAEALQTASPPERRCLSAS